MSPEKAADSVGLALQDLFHQVVDDVAVVPAKPAMKPVTSDRPCIDSAASCSAAIHPSVRPSSTATSRAVRSRPINSWRYAAASSGREPQICGADLDQFATRPQASQRQRRIGAAGDHQV